MHQPRVFLEQGSHILSSLGPLAALSGCPTELLLGFAIGPKHQVNGCQHPPYTCALIPSLTRASADQSGNSSLFLSAGNCLNPCVFLVASLMILRTCLPCFLPQAEYFVLGTWLPKQGGEDIHIFPTPFFSLVGISRCASSRLAKHKQAFRLTGSWTRGPVGMRVLPPVLLASLRVPQPPPRSQSPNILLPRARADGLIYFPPPPFLFPPCCPLTDAYKCLRRCRGSLATLR